MQTFSFSNMVLALVRATVLLAVHSLAKECSCSSSQMKLRDSEAEPRKQGYQVEQKLGCRSEDEDMLLLLQDRSLKLDRYQERSFFFFAFSAHPSF